MSHTFSSYFFFCYLDSTSFAYDTFVSYSFVFATVAFIIFDRSEDTFAEESVFFGFISSVVDSFGFENFSAGEVHYFVGRGEFD